MGLMLQSMPKMTCLPACVSSERQAILEAFGAEVVLTPAEEGTDGAIRKAHEIFEADPDRHFMPNQFANVNNVLAHYETTGPEIFAQTDVMSLKVYKEAFEDWHISYAATVGIMIFFCNVIFSLSYILMLRRKPIQ